MNSKLFQELQIGSMKMKKIKSYLVMVRKGE